MGGQSLLKNQGSQVAYVIRKGWVTPAHRHASLLENDTISTSPPETGIQPSQRRPLTADQRQRGAQGSQPQTISRPFWALRLLSNVPALHPQVASNISPLLCQSKIQTNLYTLPEGSREDNTAYTPNTPCIPKWKKILVNA